MEKAYKNNSIYFLTNCCCCCNVAPGLELEPILLGVVLVGVVVGMGTMVVELVEAQEELWIVLPVGGSGAGMRGLVVGFRLLSFTRAEESLGLLLGLGLEELELCWCWRRLPPAPGILLKFNFPLLAATQASAKVSIALWKSIVFLVTALTLYFLLP